MLHSPVLVLNRSFFPVDITTVKRAFCMLYSDIARAVDHDYRTFDYPGWSALRISKKDEAIGIVGRHLRIPRVIALRGYDRVPKRTIRFSRMHILMRDQFMCQYCGLRLPRSRLNLDHVVPRSHGGKTTWENIVTSCHACNRKKGGRLPEEAGLILIRRPFRPHAVPFLGLMESIRVHKQWEPFMTVVDHHPRRF